MHESLVNTCKIYQLRLQIVFEMLANQIRKTRAREDGQQSIGQKAVHILWK